MLVRDITQRFNRIFKKVPVMINLHFFLNKLYVDNIKAAAKPVRREVNLAKREDGSLYIFNTSTRTSTTRDQESYSAKRGSPTPFPAASLLGYEYIYTTPPSTGTLPTPSGYTNKMLPMTDMEM